MIKLVFKREDTQLATPKLKRTGRAVCKIGKTEVEVLRLELNKKLLRYNVYVTRDNYTQVFYPKTQRDLEEMILMIRDFEYSKQAEPIEKKKSRKK